jgi:hypothetical protein
MFPQGFCGKRLKALAGFGRYKISLIKPIHVSLFVQKKDTLSYPSSCFHSSAMESGQALADARSAMSDAGKLRQQAKRRFALLVRSPMKPFRPV